MENMSAPQVTEYAFTVGTRDSNQLDYRIVNINRVAGISLCVYILITFAGWVTLEKLGFIDRKGNPLEISLIASFGFILFSFSMAYFLSRTDRGVLFDRRTRAIMTWRGVSQKCSPRLQSLDVYHSLRLRRDADKAGADGVELFKNLSCFDWN